MQYMGGETGGMLLVGILDSIPHIFRWECPRSFTIKNFILLIYHFTSVIAVLHVGTKLKVGTLNLEFEEERFCFAS